MREREVSSDDTERCSNNFLVIIEKNPKKTRCRCAGGILFLR
jgi:hypothetical protein